MKVKIILLILVAMLTSSCKLAELFGGNRGGGGGGGGYGGGDYNPQDFGLDPGDYSYSPENQNEQGFGQDGQQQIPQEELLLPEQQSPPQIIEQSDITTPQENPDQDLAQIPPPPEESPEQIASNVPGAGAVDPNTAIVPPLLESENALGEAQNGASVTSSIAAHRCVKGANEDLMSSFASMKSFEQRCSVCEQKSESEIEKQQKSSYYSDFKNLKDTFAKHGKIQWNADWPSELKEGGEDWKIKRKKYLDSQIEIVLNGDYIEANFPGAGNFEELYNNPETATRLVRHLDEKQKENVVDLVKAEESKLACLHDKLCPMEKNDV